MPLKPVVNPADAIVKESRYERKKREDDEGFSRRDSANSEEEKVGMRLVQRFLDRAQAVYGKEFVFESSSGERNYIRFTVNEADKPPQQFLVPVCLLWGNDYAIMPDGTAYYVQRERGGSYRRLLSRVSTNSLPVESGERYELLEGISDDPAVAQEGDTIVNKVTLEDGVEVSFKIEQAPELSRAEAEHENALQRRKGFNGQMEQTLSRVDSLITGKPLPDTSEKGVE